MTASVSPAGAAVRIVSWNCRIALTPPKAEAPIQLRPTVAVVQECAEGAPLPGYRQITWSGAHGPVNVDYGRREDWMLSDHVPLTVDILVDAESPVRADGSQVRFRGSPPNACGSPAVQCDASGELVRLHRRV